MNTRSTQIEINNPKLARYTLILAIVWTIFIAASWVWNTTQRKTTTIALATKEAHSHFNKDVSLRLWATTHGGVYVPTDTRTPPNPYLKHLSERVITTPSGKKLTLMNPAYMLRQIMEEYSELYGIKGRITSLKPFKPQNAPDEWERVALAAFENGVKEVFEFVDIDEKPYLRLIQPLIIQEGCLKCHGYQDYKIGDIRGGVGVSVPMSKYLIHEGREIRLLTITHILVWLIGVLTIYFGFHGVKRYFADRKQAEEDLLKQQQFLQSAQKIGQIGTWELDIEKNELFWTDENYRIFGLPIGTPLTYEVFMDCVYPEDREYVDAEWKAAFLGKPYDIEHRLLVNNQVKWVREKAELKFNDKSDCISGTGVTQDITERKKSEFALKESEKRFRLLAENIPGVIYLCKNDERWSILYINEKVEQLTGYSYEKIKNNEISFAELYHPDDTEQIYQKVEQALNAQEAFHLIYRIKHKNGKWVWVEEFGIGIYEDNEVVSIEGVLSDITESKKADLEVKKAKELFQMVFESQMDSILILDSEVPAKIIECNKATETLFGYSIYELIGNETNILHVSDGHLKTFQQKLFPGIASEGLLKDFQFQMKRKDGSVFPSEHTVLELTNERGQRTGWLSIVKDISEKKEMEERVFQAQKMESIGNLAGGIAHDFNNILFPIIGMSELLIEDLPSDSLEYDNAIEILQAGKRGSELVKQILAFSRQTEHKIIPVRIQQVLKEVLKLSRSIIPIDIALKSEIDQACGTVKADSTQIHQVAMNLITNAYHAVELTEGIITVGLYEKECTSFDLAGVELSPGNYAILTISDNGTGIAPSTMDKIFEPYFTTKKQGKGTGLGLSVVYGIVKEHKGDVKVDSKVNEGTKFSVYIPILKKDSVPIPDRGIKEIEGGTEKILLVDDEPSIAKLESQLLSRLGYKVTVEISSNDALKTFKTDPNYFDLVITDMTMPQITGDKLSKEIKSIKSDTPIIICTGFSERIDNKRVESIGVNGLLMKPVTKSDMAQVVRKVLDDAIENEK